ncbi:MAG: class II glutamine amidotransferase, partial [Lentisphaeraceae bacterium]|nr:class II glutamine amidotransferase [Lentisphaeraceae bacterium]
LDTLPSAESPVAKMVREYPIKALNVIAHIRKASIGAVDLSNTHPFQREAWGMNWIFAHNGDLWNYNPIIKGTHQPVGTSDSERAFCQILNALSEKYPDCPPPIKTLYKELVELSKPIAEYGTFNFLMSNGQLLFARCTTDLYYIVRKAPFAQAHLVDKDISVDFNALTQADDRVAIIATMPLTDNEEWIKFEKDQLLVFKNGEPVIFED